MIPNGLQSAPAIKADSASLDASAGSAGSGEEAPLRRGPGVNAEAATEVKPSFEQLWPVIAIVSEHTEDYLIAWDGVDKDGKPWTPSWEKKSRVSADLIEEWRKGGRPRWKRDKKEKKRLSKLAKKARGKGAAAQSFSAVVATAGNMEMDPPTPKPKSRKVQVRSDSEEEAVIAPPPAPVASTSIRKRKSSSNLEQPNRQRVRTSAEPMPVPVPAIQVELPTSERGASVSTPQSVVSPARSAALARLSPAVPSDDELEVISRSRPLGRTSSASSAAVATHPRPLGAVPVPRPEAFAVPASSQIDPIEDPDSSPPHRRPLYPSACRQSNSAPAAPAPRFVTLVKPIRPRLELFEEAGSSPPPLDAGDGSDVEEENLPSSSDGSYFSQPVAVGRGKARPIQMARGPFTIISSGTRLIGGGGGGTVGPQAISIPLAKVPFYRPPSPGADDDDLFGGGGAAAVAVARPTEAPAMISSQSTASDFYDRTMPRLDPSQLEAVMTQYETVPQVHVTSAGGPNDAGEGGEGSRPNGGSAPSSNAQQQQSSQQQQNQTHRSTNHQPSRASASNGSGGGGSAQTSGNYYGGGGGGGYQGSFPPYNTPYGLSHNGFNSGTGSTTPKRELEGDKTEDSSKKARTNERPPPAPEAERRPPPPVAGPASMYYHSPSFPAYPTYQPPPPGYPFPPPQFTHHPQSAYAPISSYSAPAPPSSTHQSISPSLARVLGPMTSGPVHSPLASPQPTAPPTPNVIAPSPTTNAPPPLPSMPLSGALSPRRGRSVSPAPPALKSPSLARTTAFAGSAAVSRNASPAPGGGSNLDGLINLVVASPHIVESDNTKSEIVKFLRDPKAYISRPDQPLSRSAHWAFELRRMTHEGIDKTDFIILHSETGTHQLKRVARSQAQFDFARSLSHASSRSGAFAASTPGLEAGPAPLPVVTSMTRDRLEAELEALRSSSKAQAEELAALRPLVAEVAKMKTDLEKLTKQNKSLANSKEAAQNDFAYMQAQYTTASNAAVARAREAQVAEEETTKLRGMLDVGLKQRDLVAKSEKRALKLEVARLRTEVGLCRAMERRIGASGVLQKAGKWDDMVAREKYDNQMYDDREQAMLEEEEEAERERNREEAEERERERLDALERAQERAAREKREQEAAAAAPVLVPAATAEVKTEEQFACEWRMDKESQVEPCGAIVDSREALQAHLLGHLPAAEPALTQLP